MLNCEETARLLSDELEHPLTRVQSLWLRLHLMMCSKCRGFGKHIRFLRRAGKAAGTPDLQWPAHSERTGGI